MFTFEHRMKVIFQVLLTSSLVSGVMLAYGLSRMRGRRREDANDERS